MRNVQESKAMPIKRRFASVVVVSVVVLLGLIAFGFLQRPRHPSRVTDGLDDPVAMQALLLKSIPPGTSIKEAWTFMEREGFKCTDEKSQHWGDANHVQDYLYCDRLDGSITNPMKRRWQIALIEGHVQTIDARSSLVGP